MSESDVIMNRIEVRNLMGNLLIDKTGTGDYVTLLDVSNLQTRIIYYQNLFMNQERFEPRGL